MSKILRVPILEVQRDKPYIYASCPHCQSVNKGDLSFLGKGDSVEIDFSFTCRICGNAIPINVKRQFTNQRNDIDKKISDTVNEILKDAKPL